MVEILRIKEKSIPFHYRGFVAVLTYQRGDKMWHWEFKNVVETVFRGKAKDIDAARKEVKKHVDTIIGPGAG